MCEALGGGVQGGRRPTRSRHGKEGTDGFLRVGSGTEEGVGQNALQSPVLLWSPRPSKRSSKQTRRVRVPRWPTPLAAASELVRSRLCPRPAAWPRTPPASIWLLYLQNATDARSYLEDHHER